MVTVIQALWLLALSLGRKETRVERVSGGMRGGGTFFSVLGHSSRGGFRGGEEGVGGMRKRGEMED